MCGVMCMWYRINTLLLVNNYYVYLVNLIAYSSLCRIATNPIQEFLKLQKTDMFQVESLKCEEMMFNIGYVILYMAVYWSISVTIIPYPLSWFLSESLVCVLVNTSQHSKFPAIIVLQHLYFLNLKGFNDMKILKYDFIYEESMKMSCLLHCCTWIIDTTW